jgi:hypothetical protein
MDVHSFKNSDESKELWIIQIHCITVLQNLQGQVDNLEDTGAGREMKKMLNEFWHKMDLNFLEKQRRRGMRNFTVSRILALNSKKKKNLLRIVKFLDKVLGTR